MTLRNWIRGLIAAALLGGLAVAARLGRRLARLARHKRERGRSRRANGYFDPRKEAKFERANGREAGRKGPDNPAAEQVDNRAYPRGYVDDRLAAAARKAFEQKPTRTGRAAFGSAASSRRRPPGAWSALGPATGNVPGEAGQFFDPATQQGPSTQESGRVTALAIDPNCGKSSAPTGAPCRLWVAAAGGGIWRTNNALAAVADVDRAAGRPSDERLRLADRRPERREREHAVRGLRRAQRLR